MSRFILYIRNQVKRVRIYVQYDVLPLSTVAAVHVHIISQVLHSSRTAPPFGRVARTVMNILHYLLHTKYHIAAHFPN